jgi:hypothetical protein
LGTLLKTLLYKKIAVAKYKKLKTGYHMAESSEEGHGSKGAAFP